MPANPQLIQFRHFNSDLDFETAHRLPDPHLTHPVIGGRSTRRRRTSRRSTTARRPRDDEPGRALPAHVVAQLDAHLDLLARIPGTTGDTGPRHRALGVLGGRAGEVVVLTYLLLKDTGRRIGEIASLRVDCLDVDAAGKPVLVYDNHKASRMARRLPIADTSLVDAVRDQQRWVTERFPTTPRPQLWLLPRPNKNADGAAHVAAQTLGLWFRSWVTAIPALDALPAPPSRRTPSGTPTPRPSRLRASLRRCCGT